MDEELDKGLTLDVAWDHYYAHTGTTSSNVRKLAFTGIALTWIFSGGGIGNVDEVTIRGWYLWPLALLVLALVADFLQYVYLAVAWRVFVRGKEKQGTEPDDQFEAPDRINTAGEVFWVLKVVLVSTGFLWLLVSLSEQVLP
jgi:hypothetical protein